jgi:hypothetical protein
MIFAIAVMGLVALFLHNRGYSFEKMITFLLIAGAVAFFIPIGSILAVPFKIIGGILGGLGGLIGGIVGLVVGLVGGIIGLVFGAIGVAFGLVTLLGIPLLIVFVIYKIVT